MNQDVIDHDNLKSVIVPQTITLTLQAVYENERWFVEEKIDDQSFTPSGRIRFAFPDYASVQQYVEERRAAFAELGQRLRADLLTRQHLIECAKMPIASSSGSQRTIAHALRGLRRIVQD